MNADDLLKKMISAQTRAQNAEQKAHEAKIAYENSIAHFDILTWTGEYYTHTNPVHGVFILGKVMGKGKDANSARLLEIQFNPTYNWVMISTMPSVASTHFITTELRKLSAKEVQKMKNFMTAHIKTQLKQLGITL